MNPRRTAASSAVEVEVTTFELSVYVSTVEPEEVDTDGGFDTEGAEMSNKVADSAAESALRNTNEPSALVVCEETEDHELAV